MDVKEKVAEATPQIPDAKIRKISETAETFTEDSAILSEFRETLSQNPLEEDVGVFRVRSANAVVREAAATPDPTPLWLELWYYGEVSCLFADSNAGKSIYAVQIGIDIARRGHMVLYFDFELSCKQFQMRYSDGAVLYDFPPNFFRVEVNRERLGGDFDEVVMRDIEATALQTGAKVLIIDNLTWLTNEAEKGADAAALMKKLMAMKFKYGWSVLVIAHTPKRPLTNPITQNDLGGSKKLFNFFDSVFAIGKSAKDEALRYVKQVKCRYGSFRYDSQNVIVYEIQKTDALTQFVAQGYATEREHLKEPSDNDRLATAQEAKRLAAEGKSQREIARMLGMSVGWVNKQLRK